VIGIVALAIALVPAGAHAAAEAPTAEPPTAVADDGAAAIERAKAAARAGDHATALREFEAANALRPSARVSFNIAVCHHQLMLAAKPGAPEREHHREGAVAAYRAYLEGMPDADDRADVEQIIVQLGGTLPKPPSHRLPLVHPDDPPPGAPQLHDIPRVGPDTETPWSPPATNGTGGTTTTTTTPTTAKPPPPREPRAKVGPFFALELAHMRQLARSDDRTGATAKRAAFLPMLGLGVRAAALLGARRRVHTGGELAFVLQPTATRSRHTLIAAYFAGTTDYHLPLGRAKRFELAFGGLVGVLYEQLRWRGNDDDNVTTCYRNEQGEVAARAGLLLGGRIGLVALLGRRRNHELALRFGPALAVTGAGTKGRGATMGGGSCDVRPFDEVGLPDGAGLVTMIDLGYAPRF
jgi:hypothetical protein